MPICDGHDMAARQHLRADRLVQQLLPTREWVGLDESLARLSSTPVASPFDSSRVEFVADLSKWLGRKARGIPETQALAFWMRKAELHRLEESFAGLSSDQVVLMPRGTVFHIPPANVDTIFVYSWVLSMLVGNRNIIRLSARATEQSDLILQTICDVLADHPAIASSSMVITYGHDDAVTAVLSAACDVRVIWGGNATIERIRAIPLPAHASELVFADRFSMAAIAVGSYERLSEFERTQLAELFFNDTYWFDQLGCSSARLLIWVGDTDSRSVSTDFHARVRNVAAAKSYAVDASAAIAKIVQSYQAMIDAGVTEYSVYDTTLTVLEMASFPDLREEFCGAGLFYQVHVADLAAILPHIRRADQTLATYGITTTELRALVSELRGRGIDRIVPIGQALRFDRYWDGYDLLAELTRKIAFTSRDSLA